MSPPSGDSGSPPQGEAPFAVLLDIDGVLCSTNTLLGPTVIDALRLLREPVSGSHAAQSPYGMVPHLFLSNSMAREAKKSKVLTGLTKFDVKTEEIVLASSPFVRVAAQFEGKPVLVIGARATAVPMANSLGLNAVFLEDVCAAYPQSVPNITRGGGGERERECVCV
ncbi:HAD-superfamily hydrolase, subfamily IIA [Kipferlia bialata]|uniref:HAD-superfamily hydrolase, subfamily IIA n=1 Tax=Kipferlia bialata TaxID=797122 RepID=A0A9K3CVZ0_9EUKA|nr:HAD-superfamily hydrolase, subfamily IIA [Kipferlia bialata]|eukprot:g4795.t1